MFHQVDTVFNATSSKPIPGAQVQVYDASGAIVALFADESGTPIESVSSIANTAVTDGDGVYDFWVADGTYDLRFFVGQSMVRAISKIALDGSATDAVTTKANASALGVSATDSNLGEFSGSTIPPDQTAKQALQALETAVEERAPLTDLASHATGKGAGLVGFSHDATYAPGTVGRSLQRLVYVTDPPFNAVADGTTDDAPAFNAALTYLHSIGGGVLFVPRGLYTVFAEIKVPSAVTVMGSGVDVTIVKAHISLAIDQNVFTNAKNDRLERTDYDDGIHISDMTVDANWQERDDDIGPASGQGACIKFSTVRNSSIKRVKAINGILHCVDIAASTYFDDGNINHNAVGPSLDILVEDVIAMNTSWDDGITTHNSGRIVLNRCQSYRDRAAYGEPQYNQHGIEIDEGSWDVTVTDCYSRGWAGGFQAKGHNTTMPAINIIFNRCAAEECAVAFHIEHVVEVPEGQQPYARNITLRDCRAKNIGATVATPDTRLISVGGYDSVLIDGFEAEDFNEAHIVVTTNSNNVTFKNVHFWTASERSSDALGLVHMNATVAGGKVTIENLTSSVPQPIPMVRASATATILNVNGVIAFGSDPAVPCIWMSRNSQDQVRNIQQTGYVCDIFLNTDSVNLSNFVELQRGYQVLMRGSVASPEGVINGVNGAQFFSYAGTPSLWLKSGTGNAGWKKLTVAA